MERRSDEFEGSCKAAIAGRLRSIREEYFGADGGAVVAEQLGLPLRTWQNYEMGVSIPAEVMLGYLVLTGVEPLWMFSGDGTKYREPALRR